MARFPDRPRVVITGAGSGLGRAIALAFAKRQGRVLVADRHVPRGEETVQLVQKAGGVAEFVECDVTVSSQVENLAVRAAALWGGTDVLVNNAGVAGAGRGDEMSLVDWEWVLRINLWGPIYGCHAFVPRMRKQRSGFILNVASSAGIVALPEMGAYSVSKAGVIALSEVLYGEAGQDGIHVSALCPTFFKTNLMETMRASDEQRKMTAGLFNLSTVTAEYVAACALRGLERGELIIIPQRDGQLMWRLKRSSPSMFHKVIRLQQRFGLFQKLAKRAAGRE